MPFDGSGFERRLADADTIDQAINLLSRENHWCKKAYWKRRLWWRRYCIVGAIRKFRGNERILNEHILSAIHSITGERYRKVEEFNDDHRTTHSLMLQALRRTRENLRYMPNTLYVTTC